MRDSWFIFDAVRPQIRIEARFIAGTPLFSIRTLARTFETVTELEPPLSPNDPVPSWDWNESARWTNAIDQIVNFRACTVLPAP